MAAVSSPEILGAPAKLSLRGSYRFWLGLALFLLVWNGLAARYSSPFHLLHASDSTQYHLLVRNRLQGHYEVGDSAHTVRTEGLHPVWRPGLVWLEEFMARRLGSVALSAAVASSLGATLLEWLLVRLAVACFGWGAGLAALVIVLTPLGCANYYMLMAVGMGAEPWAGAAILAGLVVLVAALRQRSWSGFLLAGFLAGLAEWFRNGNHFLFAVPCAIYGLMALAGRDLRGFFMPAAAGAVFVGMIAVGGRLVPSEVDKTTMNLWHRQMEFYGDKIPNINGGPITLHLGGLRIVEGTAEDYYDYAVPHSKNVSALGYFLEHRRKIIPIYTHGLHAIIVGGASGLRDMLGNGVFACFMIQILSSLFIRQPASLHSLALAGGAVAHYLIPTALLRGDEPTQYLDVALSLFVIVAAAGVVRIVQTAQTVLAAARPAWAEAVATAHVFLLVLVLAPVVCLTVVYYQGTLNLLRHDYLQAQQEHAALDALPLEGKRVCCRNMNWFLDRNVVTVFFPYATVKELDAYARGQQINGLLLWENEPQLMFRITPYESLDQFEEALRQSRVFGPPMVSGAWHWYPIQQATEKKTTLESEPQRRDLQGAEMASPLRHDRGPFE
jgi:hypothetical protein